ncbi:hypothetical protein [Bacillus sp. AFS017336]|uniref:hypothetical protein n=1 Tax=Bacillus sp. AFS017336 TaxID=2033489 RepID=UPI000BF10014|nr:hypothetical protein [Bacillus sp. AFS017336]PEL13017.1 hypothetical protein CN601_05890 [Bacillus sp. AFS017336]
MMEHRTINGKQIEIETRIFPNEVGTKENAWNGTNINLIRENAKKKAQAKKQTSHDELERELQLLRLGRL